MKKSNKRKPLISALEPRILFDGAALTTAVDVLDNNSYDSNTSTQDSVAKNDATSNTQEAPAIQSFERDRKEIAFIDTNVEDYQTLVDGIDSNTDVYLVESFNDISNILENLNNIDSIHILSHGSTGEITIGNDILNQDTLSLYEDVLNSIKTSLNDSGDILLYGCNVGSNQEGEEFISALSNITSADIAASDDITGNSTLNGDWDLEYKKGAVETDEIEVLDFTNKLTAITIANANDQNYIERETISLAPTISFIDGGFYDKGYLLIEPQSPINTDENLTITSSLNPTDAGEISIVGNKLYVGDGTNTKVIGLIDSTLDGTSGKALKIDFINPLPNGDFETGDLTGWTVDTNFTGLSGDTHASSGLFGPVEGTANVVTKDGRTVLEMGISGTVTEAYGTGHSPKLSSSTFEASAGDFLQFDWKAQRGADYYDVLAYVTDLDTNTTVELLYQRGESSEWSTLSARIPFTSSNIRFDFYGGSYDATGGTAIASTFWIDNIAVLSKTVTDAMVTQITRQIEYTNDSYDPDSTRDFTVSVENYDGITSSDDLRLNIIAIDQAPTASNVSTIATDEDTSRSFTKLMFDTAISDMDNDPDYTKIRIVTAPVNGTLSLAGTDLISGDYVNSSDLDNLTYTPDENWYGDETFIWQAYSNGLLSNEASATITVNSVDDAPILTLSQGKLKPANDGSWFYVDQGLTLYDADEGELGKDNISEYLVYIKNSEIEDSLRLETSLHGISSSYDDTNKILTITHSTGITAKQMQDVLREVQIETTSNINGDRQIIFTADSAENYLQSTYSLQTATTNMTVGQAMNAAESYDPANNSHLASPNSQSEFDTIASLIGSNATYIFAYAFNNSANVFTSKGVTERFTTSSYINGSYEHTINSKYSFLSDEFYSGYGISDTFRQGIQAVIKDGEIYASIINNGGQPDILNGNYFTTNTSVYPYPIQSLQNGTGAMSFNQGSTNNPYKNNEALSEANGYYFAGTGTGTSPKDYYWYEGDGILSRNNEITHYLVELAPTFTPPNTDPSGNLSGSRIAQINGSNTNPTSIDLVTSVINEDSSRTFISTDFTNKFTDTDNDSMVAIKIDTIPTSGILKIGSVTLSSGDIVSISELSRLEYIPTNNYNGADNFTYFVSDGTVFSVATASASITINPINDAPTLDTITSTLTNINEDLDTSSNSGQTISSFITDAHLNDVDGAITSAIAVTSVDNTNGSWQYSLDGTTWTDFSSTQNSIVNLTSALLLDGSELVRFVANTNYNGDTTFTYRPWDKTSKATGDADSTIFDAGSSHVGTRTADIGVATLTVSALNDAPTVTSFTNTLSPINEDELTYNTFTVANFSNDKIIDIDPNSSTGIAITELPLLGNGTWQYTIDNGLNWTSIENISTTNALLLKSSDKIKFIPNEIFGTTASIKWQAWDQTNGTAGTTVDISTNGTDTAFSIQSVTSTLNVTNVNDATVITALLNLTTAEDTQIIFGTNETQEIILDDIDTLPTLDYKLRLGAVHGRITLGSLSNLAITDGADNSKNIQVQGKFSDIQNALEGLKYNPNANYFSSFYGAEKIVIEVIDINDTTDSNTISMISTKEIAIDVTSVNDTPTISVIGNDTLEDIEDIDASSQNISLSGSLSYDDVDLESGDNVDITALYNNDIVWSGGTINSTLANTLTNAFNFTNIDDETNGADASWTYSVSALDLDFLAKDETINFSYKFTVTDVDGVVSTKDISISIKGTNDTPSVNTNINLDEEKSFGERYQKETSSLFDDIDTTDVFRYEALNLPKGITIDSRTGLLSGKISSSGKFDIILKATDTAGATAQRNFEMSVLAPPSNEKPNESPKEKNKDKGEDNSKTLTDKNNEIRKENGQEEIDKNKLLNDRVKDTEKNSSKKEFDMTKTEFTTILKTNNQNPDDKLIQANTNVNISDNGKVIFGNESNEAFQTVGLTIEKLEFKQEQLEIKIIDARVGQKYRVTLFDGTALPSTLTFDPNTGIIKGTLPAGMEDLAISIKALSSDGTTRILNLKIDINDLKEKEIQNSEVKYETLKEQIQTQNYRMDGYGDYISSLFDNSSIV